MSVTPSTAPHLIVSRVAASLLGAYAFVWGFVTLSIAVQLLLGVNYADAQTLAYLLAFLLFLAGFVWAFATRSLRRVWLGLLGGGVLMSVAAWLMARFIL